MKLTLFFTRGFHWHSSVCSLEGEPLDIDNSIIELVHSEWYLLSIKPNVNQCCAVKCYTLQEIYEEQMAHISAKGEME